MSRLRLSKRGLSLALVLVPLLLVFVYVVVRSGPLAPVAVVVEEVTQRSAQPTLDGIGTVGVRHHWKIGPTAPGRVKSLTVDVGDRVKAGAEIGHIAPVDLDSRIAAQGAAYKAAEAGLRKAEATVKYAQAQWARHRELVERRAVSREAADRTLQELTVAQETVNVAREQMESIRAEQLALEEQMQHLHLVTPSDGLVVARYVDPGTTVVAGQTVIELIDPETLWIDTRFDQTGTRGLVAGLKAKIMLRSQGGKELSGRILRIEPVADEVTEELLAKVVLDEIPELLPAMGELAEVIVNLPAEDSALSVSNASIHVIDGKIGVWRLSGNRPIFVEVLPGRSDRQGWTSISSGLALGDEIVRLTEKPLHHGGRVRLVKSLTKS